MKIDDVNIEIIKELRHGRKSFKKIADQLNITENTVRTRVNKLKEEGVLEICGLFDPSCLPGHQTVIIGIKLSAANLVEKGRGDLKTYGGNFRKRGHRAIRPDHSGAVQAGIRTSGILHQRDLQGPGNQYRGDLCDL